MRFKRGLVSCCHPCPTGCAQLTQGREAEASDHAERRADHRCDPLRFLLRQDHANTTRIIHSAGNQTHPHDPHHSHPIEDASPVQRVTRSVARVWAKIPFDNRSGDLYITMQQLELHIPTAAESRGQAAPPEMTRGFLGRGSASIFWSGVAECRGTRILHRRARQARSGTPEGGKSRFPNFIVSIPKIVDEVYRCHVGSSFWLSELR